MAAENENGGGGCTIQWKIENIGHCWLEHKEGVESPTFIADAVGGTKYSMALYPKGDGENGDEDTVNFILQRDADCDAPDEVIVSFQLAFLGKDGSILKEKTYSKELFPKNSDGFAVESRERVFVTEREAFLPEDTLTLQCTIWNTDEKPVLTQNIFALTVFKVNRRSFDVRIDKVSTRKPGLTNKFKTEMMNFDIFLNDGVNDDKKLAIDIKSSNESVKYFSFTTFIVDAKGRKEILGTREYFADDLQTGVRCEWFASKCVVCHMPNDVLSLEFEYVCSDGEILNEYCDYGIVSPALANEVTKFNNKLYTEKQESVDSAVILNDLKFMYSEGICSDAELRTSTQTFAAHKCILSARSPVFRQMFSHDMNKNQNGLVTITDFDADTVHRMLQYVYTDSLEDLHFDGALKLYAIADKYEIASLKSMYSSFLKENLCPTNASKTLVLADLHQDDDLIKYVQDYILQKGKAVFSTDEWRDLMTTHLELASGIMFKKVNA